MFSGLLNIMYTDYPGGEADLLFLYNQNWLLNSAVNSRMVQQQGRWHIFLVMAWVVNPYRFITRFISTAPTLQKAGIYADAYARTAQKDKRGSLKINYEDFNICPN
jgi:hypothetical protein